MPTVLMPVPAWKLRSMTAKDMLELTGAVEDQADAGAGRAGGDASDDVKMRRAAARKRRRQAKRAQKRAAAHEKQQSGAAHALAPAPTDAPGGLGDVSDGGGDEVAADGAPNDAAIGDQSSSDATRGAASNGAADVELRLDDAVLAHKPASGDGDVADADMDADADDPRLAMQDDAALAAAKEQAAKRVREAAAAKQNPISKRQGKRGKTVTFCDSR